jgi:hypothetical protein
MIDKANNEPVEINIRIGRGYHPKGVPKVGSNQAWIVIETQDILWSHSQIDEGEWESVMGHPLDPHLTAVAERWLSEYDEGEA